MVLWPVFDVVLNHGYISSSVLWISSWVCGYIPDVMTSWYLSWILKTTKYVYKLISVFRVLLEDTFHSVKSWSRYVKCPLARAIEAGASKIPPTFFIFSCSTPRVSNRNLLCIVGKTWQWLYGIENSCRPSLYKNSKLIVPYLHINPNSRALLYMSKLDIFFKCWVCHPLW